MANMIALISSWLDSNVEQRDVQGIHYMEYVFSCDGHVDELVSKSHPFASLQWHRITHRETFDLAGNCSSQDITCQGLMAKHGFALAALSHGNWGVS